MALLWQKAVFQIHGEVDHGKPVLRKKLDRSKMLEFFMQLPPCLIGMEPCGSAHYWARKLTVMGHTVKLMASQFVKPYVKTNKNDVADAEAICEAVSRPKMRFVPMKTDEQQAVLALHRVRQSFLKVRTAQANQIRGLLSQFGVIIPQGSRRKNRGTSIDSASPSRGAGKFYGSGKPDHEASWRRL